LRWLRCAASEVFHIGGVSDSLACPTRLSSTLHTYIHTYIHTYTIQPQFSSSISSRIRAVHTPEQNRRGQEVGVSSEPWPTDVEFRCDDLLPQHNCVFGCLMYISNAMKTTSHNTTTPLHPMRRHLIRVLYHVYRHQCNPHSKVPQRPERMQPRGPTSLHHLVIAL
jgi:hypothetical protein